jgi:hypothetical protein
MAFPCQCFALKALDEENLSETTSPNTYITKAEIMAGKSNKQLAPLLMEISDLYKKIGKAEEALKYESRARSIMGR